MVLLDRARVRYLPVYVRARRRRVVHVLRVRRARHPRRRRARAARALAPVPLHRRRRPHRRRALRRPSRHRRRGARHLVPDPRVGADHRAARRRPPPVDELPRRAAVRAGQRRHRPLRRRARAPPSSRRSPSAWSSAWSSASSSASPRPSSWCDGSGSGSLPEGVTLRHVVGMGAIAGIGFTVSIFVGGLAFDDRRPHRPGDPRRAHRLARGRPPRRRHPPHAEGGRTEGLSPSRHGPRGVFTEGRARCRKPSTDEPGGGTRLRGSIVAPLARKATATSPRRARGA